MRFTKTHTGDQTEILKYALPGTYVAMAFDCSSVSPNSDDGKFILPGTIIPFTNGVGETEYGVLLTPVNPDNNPNGSLVIYGFIDTAKIPAAPTATELSGMPMLKFL